MEPMGRDCCCWVPGIRGRMPEDWASAINADAFGTPLLEVAPVAAVVVVGEDLGRDGDPVGAVVVMVATAGTGSYKPP